MTASIISLTVILFVGIHVIQGLSYYRNNPYYKHRYIHRRPLCGRLKDPDNGNVKQRGIKVGSKASYRCDTGFVLSGMRFRVCQADGTFSGTAPTCELVDCGEPDRISNGDVFFSATTFGSTARYVCNRGFNLVGAETVVCQADGTYSDNAPQCTPVDCGPPEPADPNGSLTLQGGTTVGNIVLYNCNDGFTLVGLSISECTVTGEYSNPAPVCQLIDCGEPDRISNGDVFFSATTFGSTARYVCNRGFNLVGAETIVCQADGTYSDSAPQCTPVDCGPPEPADPNGSLILQGGTTVGNIVLYNCNDGFVLVGLSISECTVTGEYSNPAPVCQPVDCGPLSDPANGNVVTVPDSTLNSIATYSCRRGFKLSDDNQRVCQVSGQWSGVQPTCQRIKCPELRPPKFGRLFYSGYYPGDHATYQCSRGYRPVHGHRYRRLCLHSGVWSGSDIKCRAIPYYGKKDYYLFEDNYSHY